MKMKTKPDPQPEPARRDVFPASELQMIREMEAGGLRVRRVDNGAAFRAILVVPERLVVGGEDLLGERGATYGKCVDSLYCAWIAAGRPNG